MSKKIERPAREDIINYYINTTRTAADSAKHYGMSETVFRRTLKFYNLRKDNIMKQATHQLAVQCNRKYSKPTKQELEEIYIIQNKTKKECCQIIGCSSTQLARYLAEYNIKKSAELRSNIAKAIADQKKVEINVPSKQEIIDYYLNAHTTKKDAAKHFGVSVNKFSKWLVAFDIHKSIDMIQETINFQVAKKKDDPAYIQNIIAKREKTCMKKYGFSNPSKVPDIRQKISEAESLILPQEELREKYLIQGWSQDACAEYFKCSKEVIKNNLDRYKLNKDQKQINAGRQQTCINKYGSMEAFFNNTVKKTAETSLLKYGVLNPTQKNIKNYEIWTSKEKYCEWLKTLNKKPTSIELAKFFNVDISRAISHIHEFEAEDLVDLSPLRSHYEDEIVAFLRELGVVNIELNNRTILDGQEIDIYLPDYHFGIEFNGDYFHSDLVSKYQDHNGRSTRHQEKSLLAESKGVFLFHIFEHEWNENFLKKNKNLDYKQNILNRIQTILKLNTQTIGARKCKIKEISKEEKNKFLDENHMQGSERHSSYAFGLYYKNELVACMTFGKSKFKKYNWDLMRFCSKHGFNIQGGASRLFSYFLKNYVSSGETIVSYSDITKTIGTLYETLGFELQSINAPNYWWVNLDNCEVISRYSTQMPNEVKTMHEAGYCCVSDCGTKTWLYTKK